MAEAYQFVESTMEDRLEDMIHEVGVQTFTKVVYENMTTDVETPLYPCSTNFKRLSRVSRLINLSDGMEYKKIHARPNDYILYRKEFAELRSCPKCGLSRYKVEDGDKENTDEVTKHDPPSKVVWYLPIIPRFKHMLENPTNAKNLRWHTNEQICDGLVRHPVDFVQWKNIDKEFPTFGNESRNLRLGLTSDGINPYGNLSTNHSS